MPAPRTVAAIEDEIREARSLYLHSVWAGADIAAGMYGKQVDMLLDALLEAHSAARFAAVVKT